MHNKKTEMVLKPGVDIPVKDKQVRLDELLDGEARVYMLDCRFRPETNLGFPPLLVPAVDNNKLLNILLLQ